MALVATIGTALVSLSHAVRAQELLLISEGRVAPAVVSDGLGWERGRWRMLVQQTYDATSRKLERRLYSVFDQAPSRNLDVTWLPADPRSSRAGRISGTGKLVWRRSGALEWDSSAVVATYSGEFRNGQPNGQGELLTRDGLAYRGAWRAGRADGDGRLQLPGGEEYVGKFRGGFASGGGHFIDTTGERFDGAFAAGLPDGRGRTILPTGLAYASDWTRGIESVKTRRVRLAQTGGGSSADGEDLRIGVIVPRTPALPRDVSAEDVVLYESSNGAGVIHVAPSDKKLMAVWKRAGELQTADSSETKRGIFGFTPRLLDATPPTFQLAFENRSAAPVNVVELRLEVSESETDLQPAIQLVNAEEACSASAVGGEYSLENYGWSSAKASKFRLSFSSDSTESGREKFNVIKTIGDLKDGKSFSFTPELTEAGVDVARLKNRGEFPCANRNIAACFAHLRTSSIFGTLGGRLILQNTEIQVPIRGVYDYTWTDGKGIDHRRTSPFRLNVYLARFPTMTECGEGAAPTALRKSPVELRLDAKDYSLPLSFRRTISAGQTARFTLQLSAAKASLHKFKFTAVLADGRRMSSLPVNMTFFRPRS